MSKGIVKILNNTLVIQSAGEMTELFFFHSHTDSSHYSTSVADCPTILVSPKETIFDAKH